LPPRSMTLDDLERKNRGFTDFSVILGCNIHFKSGSIHARRGRHLAYVNTSYPMSWAEICSQWAFKHASLSRVLLCVSWAFLVISDGRRDGRRVPIGQEKLENVREFVLSGKCQGKILFLKIQGNVLVFLHLFRFYIRCRETDKQYL